MISSPFSGLGILLVCGEVFTSYIPLHPGPLRAQTSALHYLTLIGLICDCSTIVGSFVTFVALYHEGTADVKAMLPFP